MVGYNEKAERANIAAAVEAFWEKIGASADRSAADALAAYAKTLKGRAGRADREAFADFLKETRKSLIFDGTEWRPRPFDLLSHTDTGMPTTAEEKAGIFRLCAGWELLTLCFDIVKQNDDRSALPGQLEAAAGRCSDRFWKMRSTYDVFDNELSYIERMARHQGKNLPDHADIVVPYGLYTKKISKNWADAVLFCTMVYRHLRNIGITAEQLEANDYWALPGGVEGIGAYRPDPEACTAETFYHRVRRELSGMEKPPVRLLSLNGVLMVKMDPEIYTAFMEAEMQAENGASDDLWVKDDGTRSAAEYIYAHIKNYQAAEMNRAKAKDASALIGLFKAKGGGEGLWKHILAEKTYENWKAEVEACLPPEAGREKRTDLRLLGSENGANAHIPHLLVGYLVHRKDRMWTGTKAALWNDLADVLNTDAEGSGLSAYRKYLTDAPRLTVMEKKEDSFVIRLADQIQVAKDAATMSMLDKVLTADGQPTFEQEEYPALADLFENAAAALPGMKAHCQVDLKAAQHNVRMRSFLLLVLHWMKIGHKSFSLEIDGDGRLCENGVLLEPFPDAQAAADFRAFLRRRAGGGIGQHLKLSKQSDRGYTANFSDMQAARLDAAETALLKSLTPKDGTPYTVSLDMEVMNSLLRKAIPRLQVDLPKSFSDKKLLDIGEKKKEQYNAFLVLISLFELNREKEDLLFVGSVDLKADYQFDQTKMEAFQAFLPRLAACRAAEKGKRYYISSSPKAPYRVDFLKKKPKETADS